MDCIFCKIIKKEIPSKIIYEDDIILVMMDINPVNDGHVLIIPKKHYDDILGVDDQTLNYMLKKAQELTPIIMKKLNKQSMTLLINYGDDQQVKHLHLHLIPDYTKAKNHPKLKDVNEIYNILKN